MVIKSITIKFGKDERYIERIHEEYGNDVDLKKKISLVGVDAKFKCTFPVYNFGDIKWYINGEKLEEMSTNDTEKFEKIDASTKYLKSEILTVKNITLDDKGKYMCQLMSEENSYPGFWKWNLSTILLVEQGQEAIVLHLDKKVENKRIRLDCRIMGLPQANLTWYKNYVPIDKVHFSTKVLVSNESPIISTSHLLINDLASENLGTYSCEAENILNTDIKSIEIEDDRELKT